MTGGIAAYKAATLVRLLVAEGHDVHVVPTLSALRFVGAPTWEALSRNPVFDNVFDDVAAVRHVQLGQSADLVIVAPATAHSIAKLALGLSDDLLGTTVLATTAPVLVAPAMHSEMWAHPATVANMETLRQRDVNVIGPESGPLTGGDIGPGRMSEPKDIVAAAHSILARSHDLAGRRILISAGGTREPLDPVRYLGNNSSGRQAMALAEACLERGATVCVVQGFVDVVAPAGAEVVLALTAAEMHREMIERLHDSDVVFMAAAVADYRPVRFHAEKMSKSDVGEKITLDLVANPDILAELVKLRKPGQTIIGFAAETENDDELRLERAREKQERKGCDLLVLNQVGIDSETGRERVFGSDENTVSVIGAHGEVLGSAQGDKLLVARAILELVFPPQSKESSR